MSSLCSDLWCEMEISETFPLFIFIHSLNLRNEQRSINMQNALNREKEKCDFEIDNEESESSFEFLMWICENYTHWISHCAARESEFE